MSRLVPLTSHTGTRESSSSAVSSPVELERSFPPSPSPFWGAQSEAAFPILAAAAAAALPLPYVAPSPPGLAWPGCVELSICVQQLQMHKADVAAVVPSLLSTPSFLERPALELPFLSLPPHRSEEEAEQVEGKEKERKL